MSDTADALREWVASIRGEQKHEPEPDSGFSAKDAIVPTAIAGTTGMTYYGSRALDRRLNAAGLATEMGGVHTRDIGRFAKSIFSRAPDSMANYADAASDFLGREVSKGVNGLGLLKVMGNATYQTGSDMGKLGPMFSPFARILKRKGAQYRADFKHPHFNGFSTPGAGIRTLIGEKANWGGLSLENMGHIARKSLEANGWKANSRAARMFDKEFRRLIREGYSFRPLRNSNKDVLPILEEIVRKHKPGASAQEIARSMMPDADISKSLYDAVKGKFLNSNDAKAEVANLSKTMAGKLALMAASGTSRLGSVQHGAELALLRALKTLRGRNFRIGALAAGTTAIGGILANKLSKKAEEKRAFWPLLIGAGLVGSGAYYAWNKFKKINDYQQQMRKSMGNSGGNGVSEQSIRNFENMRNGANAAALGHSF